MKDLIEQMRRVWYVLTPRGYGRNAYLVSETVQARMDLLRFPCLPRSISLSRVDSSPSGHSERSRSASPSHKRPVRASD